MLEWNYESDRLESKCERFIIDYHAGAWWLYWKEDRSMLNEQMPRVCFPGTGRILSWGSDKNFTYIQNDSKEEAMEVAMDLLKEECRIGAPPIIWG